MDEAGRIRYSSPVGRWVLGVTVLGSSIAFLEATVVNVALPEIGRDLGADVAGLQWVINGYLSARGSRSRDRGLVGPGWDLDGGRSARRRIVDRRRELAGDLPHQPADR